MYMFIYGIVSLIPLSVLVIKSAASERRENISGLKAINGVLGAFNDGF